MLHRHHHRGGRCCWARLGDLPHIPLAVDVVVGPLTLLDPLGDVVCQERLSGHDHAALHAAAVAVQRQRWQALRIDAVAFDPRVLAADQLVFPVVRRDHDAVVGDDIRKQLAEAVVHALRLERLTKLPRDVEQEPRDLSLAFDPLFLHLRTVARPRAR